MGKNIKIIKEIETIDKTREINKSYYDDYDFDDNNDIDNDNNNNKN